MADMLIDRAKVVEEMARRGWSQVDLASICGCTTSAISQLLSGQIKSPRLIGDVARAFGLDVRELLLERSVS